MRFILLGFLLKAILFGIGELLILLSHLIANLMDNADLVRIFHHTRSGLDRFGFWKLDAD